MKYLQVGSLTLSVIGLGTWQIGTRSWGWGTEYGPTIVEEILDAAVESGINLIDTAELYGQGESERQLGIHLSNISDTCIVASKGSPWHLTNGSVVKAANRSLQRLNRTSLDLYQIHAPNPLIPISRTMSGIRTLIQEGKVREVGVSNYSPVRWKYAERALGSTVIMNQVECSLLHPKPFSVFEPMLDANHFLMAYSPLAMGLLTGKYGPQRKPAGARSKHSAFGQRNYHNVIKVLEVTQRIAKSHLAMVSQIALAWIISHPNVIAIPGAKSAEQVKQNAAAAEIELSESEIAALDDISNSYSPALHIPSVFEGFKWLVGVG